MRTISEVHLAAPNAMNGSGYNSPRANFSRSNLNMLTATGCQSADVNSNDVQRSNYHMLTTTGRNETTHVTSERPRSQHYMVTGECDTHHGTRPATEPHVCNQRAMTEDYCEAGASNSQTNHHGYDPHLSTNSGEMCYVVQATM